MPRGRAPANSRRNAAFWSGVSARAAADATGPMIATGFPRRLDTAGEVLVCLAERYLLFHCTLIGNCRTSYIVPSTGRVAPVRCWRKNVSLDTIPIDVPAGHRSAAVRRLGGLAARDAAADVVDDLSQRRYIA